MGPQRAGTTWVDRYLRERGHICMPEEVKEVFFFDRNFKRGTDFYKSHFKPETDDLLAMEITATSFDCPEAPLRIHNIFGKKLKLICPLRHPIIRSYSLYLHYLRYGIVKGSLQEAVEQVPQIIESSHYAEHLTRWFDTFGRENITILYQEELESDQNSFVAKLCTALSIPFVEAPNEVSGKYNITSYSKFGPLALFAQNFADILRKYRLYFVINIAKSMGLKKVIFGEERPEINKNKIPKEDWDWLNSKIGDEIQKYETLIGKPVTLWHNLDRDHIHE